MDQLRKKDEGNFVDLQNIVVESKDDTTSSHISEQNYILGIGSEPTDSDVFSDQSSIYHEYEYEYEYDYEYEYAY